MTGYELIQYIADNQLGNADVIVEGDVNVEYPPDDEDASGSGKVSVDATEIKGKYRGSAIILTFDADINIR